MGPETIQNIMKLADIAGWEWVPSADVNSRFFTFSAKGETFTLSLPVLANLAEFAAKLERQPATVTTPPTGALTNDAEYEAAVQRLSDLWDARPGSPEEMELHDLAERVEAYELKNFWPDNKPMLP
jgi:hypothetical protein